MKVQILFFVFVAAQAAYTFCSDDEQSRLIQTITSQLPEPTTRCDKFFQPKYYCSMFIGSSIGGAITGGIKSVLHDSCTQYLPLNVTESIVKCIVRTAVDTVVDVGGGALLGVVICGTAIGGYWAVKYCCSPLKKEATIA